MRYGRSDSPYINHFVSADTIIPDPSNPQSWNRYSYVTNNPLRYTDPTGHSQCQTKDDCEEMGTTPMGQGGGNNYKPKPKKDKKDEHPRNPIESYCGNAGGLACAANFAQDVATLTDLVGVGLIEAPAVAVGCIEGGPLGCAIAEVGVAVTWTTTLNNIETGASSLSLVLTIADDFNNGGWGENSSTSLATWVVGLAPLTPSWDLAVDTYASGYNHGFFNGVNTILNNGLFK